MALTSDDIAALRKSSSVAFQATRDGHAIRAILDKGRYAPVGDPVIYTAREQRLFPETRTYDTSRERTIVVDANLVSYDTDLSVRRGEQFAAFYLDQFASMADWQSIASLLRVGDDVALRWTAANNSEVTNGVGHVRDELRIEFGGSHKRTFLVNVQVGPRNSARMVKPGGSF